MGVEVRDGNIPLPKIKTLWRSTPTKKRLRERLQRIPRAREAGGDTGGVRAEAEDGVRGQRREDGDPAAVGRVGGLG